MTLFFSPRHVYALASRLLLAIVLLALLPTFAAQAQTPCSPGVGVMSASTTPFAIITQQSFTATCTGKLTTLTITSSFCDDLRSSGYSVIPRIKDATGATTLAQLPRTDQYRPYTLLTFDFSSANVVLTASTQYRWEFECVENNGGTAVPLILGDLRNGNPYAGGQLYQDGVASSVLDFLKWNVNIVAAVQTGTIASPLCAGSVVAVPFTTYGTIGSGNTYTAQLSNASGSFAAPVTIGTLSSTAASGTISATVPAGTASGAGYRIQVVASTTGFSAVPNTSNLSISNTAAPTGAASQSFSTGATVANLAATGSNIQWYAASTGGTALVSTTPLANGTTYYASQTVSGYESCNRLAVTATVAAPATAPTVTTAAASSLTSTSATLGGNVTADGGASITERGVVYVAGIGTPTTSNTKITASGTTGSYSVSATGLSAGTQYTVRAYATNSVGTSYGSSVSFTTAAALAATLSSQTNVSCNGGSNGTATVSVTGGTAPYTYSWSPSGGTAATATGLSAGTYTVTVTDAASQTTTAQATITQPTALTATTSQTNVTTTGGTNGTATVSVSGGTPAYTYSWSTTPVQTTATATGLPAGTYTVTVTDANGCTLQRSVTLTQPTTAPDLTVSTGTSAAPTTVAAGTYNSLTVTGTGYAQLGGAVVVNSTVAVQNGGTLSTNCQSLTGAASFTLNAGGTLIVCDANGLAASGSTGAVQTTGTRSFSADASYVYNGTAAQATGTGLPAQVRNLSATNVTTVTLSQPVAVRQVLTASSGQLATGGLALTLLSDATGTALLFNDGSGRVVGNLTVQRYLDPSLNPGLGYRHLGLPVRGLTVAAFASGGGGLVANPGYNTAAQPGAVTPFPTIFSYDQARLISSPATTGTAFDKGWQSPAALTDAADVGDNGFAIQLTGGQTLSFTGAAYQTTGIFATMSRNAGATADDAGWQFIGNPYPSPLDWSTVATTQRPNVDAAMYVFESTSQYGGNYRSYANGVGASPLIGSGQGFWVRVSQGQTSSSFRLLNTNRVTDYARQAPVRRTTTDPRPLVQLDLRTAGGLADAFYAYAETGATAGFDSEYDAAKLPNTHGLNVSSTSALSNLAIDGRPAFTTATVFPLAVGVPAAGTYTITAAAIANLPAGLTAYLRDAEAGTFTALASGTTYAFVVTAAQATALVTGRFTLQFSATALAATPAALAAQVQLFPNPTHDQATLAVPGVAGASTVQAELLNSLGQVVSQQSAALPAAGAQLVLPTAGLAAGVYVVRLTAGSVVVTKRLTVQ